MKKRLVIALIVVVLAALLFAGANALRLKQARPVFSAPFITANPVELSQIAAISQFRSCEGHNYSGLNVQGEEEAYRTMKHYLEAVPELAQTEGRVNIFAPFTGRISQLGKDPRGSQPYLSPDDDSNSWDFIFFHVDLLPAFNNKGAQFTAGDHIGYANLIDAANFDFSLRNFGFGGQRNASPFSYMTEEVLATYAAAGVTLDNIIISQEERDAAPCELAPGQSGRDAFYAQSESGKSWVTLPR